MIKVVIFVLLLGIVISLFSGLVFLFKDVDKAGSKRTLYALGVRVSLAVMLILTMSYGIYTGELTVSAPWDKSVRAAEAAASDKQTDTKPDQQTDTQTATP